MPITIGERANSRERSGQTVVLRYVVEGTDSDALVLSTVLAIAPSTYEGLIREETPAVQALFVDENAADGTWECDVRYIPANRKEQEPPAVGSIRIRGGTRSVTTHIMASLETVAAYGTGAAVGDNGKLMNVTGSGVEGVDINVPVTEFSVSKVFAAGNLPSLATLDGLVCKTNSLEWTVTDSVTGLARTCAIGECLFTGYEHGDARADGGVEFTFHFSRSVNKTGLSVGSISNIAKKGWEYLWARYEPAEIAGIKLLGQSPKAVYVERVYDSAAFSGLGLS
jgi:hypothetical protein